MKSWKEFLKMISVLIIPMALQNLINVGISSVDVIMLGKVNETVLSGASLGAQVHFIMSLVLFGLSSGASVLIAQYWGKNDVKSIQVVFGIVAKVACTVGFLFTVVTFSFAEPIMHIFSNSADVIAEGCKYLRIVCFSYLINAFTMIYLNTMRAIGVVKIATIVYFCSMITNIVANGIFIFGYFGAPRMEVEGAALGTVIARCVELLIVLFFDRIKNQKLQFHFFYLRLKEKNLFKDFLKYSIPVVINELMWGAGVSCIAAILGHINESVVAANSFAQVARQLATVVGFGVASAAAIVIGQTIGEGKTEVARVYGKRFGVLGVITGLLGGIVILLVRPFLVNGFEMSALSREYLATMMFIMAYFVVGQAINTIMIVGIVRGGGDTKFGLFLDVGIMWGVAIFGGFLAAFVFDAPVMVVYMILLSDEVIKVPIVLKRYLTYKWCKNVTREKIDIA